MSFVRHRDLHILTVGTYTYTSDQRFTATYHRDTNEWTLQIKWAQKRDAGAYECQISTQPVKSYSIDLNIVGEFDANLIQYKCRNIVTHVKDDIDNIHVVFFIYTYIFFFVCDVCVR